MQRELEDNRRNWDDRVDIHFMSAEYDVDGFIAGRSSLPRVDLDALGDVQGKSLVHRSRPPRSRRHALRP